jgi:hypothetical protein
MDRRVERRILIEDRALQALELGPRDDPEFLGQRAMGVLVGLECLGLAARPVEGEHELAAQPLPPRVLAHERLQLADDGGGASEREVRLDPLLEGAEPELLEAGDLGLSKRFVGELTQRGAAPQSNGLMEEAGGGLDVGGRHRAPAVGEKLLEALGVQAAGLDPEQIPPGVRQQDRAGLALRPARLERLSEPGHVDLQGARRCRRRSRTPEIIDEAIAGDDLVRAQQEDREQRPLLGGDQGYRPALVADLEGSKDTELHPPSG